MDLNPAMPAKLSQLPSAYVKWKSQIRFAQSEGRGQSRFTEQNWVPNKIQTTPLLPYGFESSAYNSSPSINRPNGSLLSLPTKTYLSTCKHQKMQWQSSVVRADSKHKFPSNQKLINCMSYITNLLKKIKQPNKKKTPEVNCILI